MYRDDPLVVQSCGDARLSAKAFALLLRPRDFVAQHFDRHEPVQHDVAREKDDPHPSAADLAHDLIGASDVRFEKRAFDTCRGFGAM